MRFKSLLIFALLSTLPSLAQDPEITFYSVGSTSTQNTPHANHAVFRGALFDGKQKIGLIRPNQFLTITLSPGPHTFSASMSARHPAENSQLSLVLKTGEKYFVRVQTEWRGIMLVEKVKGRLDVTTCQNAIGEASKTVAANPKEIADAIKVHMVSGTFPNTCE